MIQASELRIDNLVYNLVNQTCKIAEISGITETVRAYNLDFWQHEVDFGYSCNEISGIPLTEELLLKIGFEYWNGGSKNLHLSAWQIPQAARFDIDFIDGKIYLKSRYDQKNLPAQWMPQITFIHQVQNLYHVLSGGQELTLS